MLVELPNGLWSSFWYTSGWNQFRWDGEWYLPLWLMLIPAMAVGFAVLWRRQPNPAIFLGTVIGVSLAVFVYLGLITTQVQARVAFVGLPALALVAAVGLERLPVLARFVLPAAMVVGVWVALRSDVLDVYMR